MSSSGTTQLPKTTAQYTITASAGFNGLKYHSSVPITQLGPTSCLIKFEAVSLNYRDIAMAKGEYPAAHAETFVPCSDGTGTVVAIGSNVEDFQPGDRVCTLFNQWHQSGFLTPAMRRSSLGSLNDGVLREYAVFNEKGLVKAPKSLDVVQSSTLPCAAVTAWNCLFGLESRALKKGDYILTQGTGGVSMFAIQFALATGAVVIATTSSEEKAKRLKEMGVQHVINYREDKNWGETAKKLSFDGDGVHHVVEVGGNATLEQSFKAIRIEGVISIVGFLGGKAAKSEAGILQAIATCSIVRGVNVGSKDQFKAMNGFIDEHKIKPVVDEKVFDFKQAREAYEYMWDKKHWGKVVVRVAA